MHKKIKPIIYAYHWDVIGNDRMPQTNIESEFLEYRKQWEQNPINHKVSEFPLNLDIEVSGRCNLMCIHCTRHSRRTNVGDMDMVLFKKIVDEGVEHGLPAIIPHWLGESFLHPQLMEMITYAKSKDIMDIRINSNCTLITPYMAHKIIDSGLDTIICSIDSVTKNTYNRIKLGSDFNLVHQNIEQLFNLRNNRKLSKPKIIVQMIDMRQTHEELTSFVDYWRVRADKVRIATYQSPDGRPNDINRVHNAPESIFPCPQLWQRLVIAWDGAVYSCIGNNACRYPLGNVSETSLYDIWHGEKMNSLRELHRNYKSDHIEMCLHCDLNKIPKTAKNYEGEVQWKTTNAMETAFLSESGQRGIAI